MGTAGQKAERLNHARHVLAQVEALPDAVERMVRDCGISSRQAYRDLRHARRLRAPVPVPDATIAFTVKLPGLGAGPPCPRTGHRSVVE